MKEVKHDFRKINGISFLFIILTIILIIFVDYPYSLTNSEDEVFRIWYLDNNFGWSTDAEKGPGMVLSMIFNIIAAVIFIPVIFSLKHLRDKKKNHYLSKTLFYTAVYLAVGRIIEAFYIMTETSVRSILLVAGRFFIPLDNLAMVLFFGICADVFFSEEIRQDEKIVEKIQMLKWVTLIVSWLAIVLYFTYNEILVGISNYILQVLIAIIFLVSLRIEFKVMNLKKKIDEKKDAIQRIGQILLLFIMVSLCTLLLITTYPNLLQYLLRTFKNILISIIGLLYYPAFIKPGQNKE